MPPFSVSVVRPAGAGVDGADGAAEGVGGGNGGAGEGWKSKSGSAIWRRSVVDPAVTESAMKCLEARSMGPGVNVMERDPFFAPVSVALDMWDASSRPVWGGRG